MYWRRSPVGLGVVCAAVCLGAAIPGLSSSRLRAAPIALASASAQARHPQLSGWQEQQAPPQKNQKDQNQNQEKDKSKSREKDYVTAQPSAVHVPALAYAAAIEDATPSHIKDWCRDAARKLAGQPIDPRSAMLGADRVFPQYSDAQRDAITYLLIYHAYRDELLRQDLLAAEIRRLDLETDDLLLQMQLRREAEMNRMVSTRNLPSQQEMLRNDEEYRKADLKLRELAERRRIRRGELERARRRVEGYLKVIAVTYPRMDGIPAGVLAGLR